MKTATIKEITPTGTWTNKDGIVFYKFDYTMEDGEFGGCLHKTKEAPHHAGQVIEYDMEKKGNFTNIVFPKEKSNFASKFTPKDPAEEARRQTMIVRQSSLKCATDLVCNKIIDYDDLILIAQRLTDWATGDQAPAKMEEPSDKMPF